MDRTFTLPVTQSYLTVTGPFLSPTFHNWINHLMLFPFSNEQFYPQQTIYDSNKYRKVTSYGA